jgi:phosphoglycerate dehydrogenase-like enzyme
MTRVAVLDDYQGVALTMADWSVLDGRATVDSFRDHIVGADELVDRLAEYDVIVCMRERTALGRAVLERLPRLRLLVTTGPFNAAIDVTAAHEQGIVVCGTGGAIHNTSELTWALILACARWIPTEDANVKAGGWMTTVGTDLFQKTLGICGLGRLGGLVAAVGQAFGMRVIAWSQNLTEARCAEVGATRVDKETLFREADVLSIHLVLSDRTRGLVGRDELALMKPSAILVNSSRGPIVDEDALVAALEQRQIRAAGLDAYSVEPLPLDHPFRRLDNIVTTPHLGYVTEGCYRIFHRDIVEDIVAWLDGRPVRLVS